MARGIQPPLTFLLGFGTIRTMAHALVTGATGFIGGHLVQRLKDRGDRVTCLIRKTSQVDRLRELGVEFVLGDVADANSISGHLPPVDVVYHLAGLTKALTPAELLRVNAEGMRNLAQACVGLARPPVLIVVSSLAAAGTAPGGRLRTEADPPQPVSHYGRSKRECERIAESFADRLPITVIQPPIIFGEGDREMFRMIRPIARFGVHVVPGFTTRRFSLAYVGDVADGMILAAERGSRLPARATVESPPNCTRVLGQGYYFLAADEHPSYADLGRLMADACDRRWFRAVRVPEAVAWLTGGTAQLASRLRGKPGILNLDKVTEAVAGSWICSSEKAKQELGYQPAAPVLAQMQQTVAWYRQHHWL